MIYLNTGCVASGKTTITIAEAFTLQKSSTPLRPVYFCSRENTLIPPDWHIVDTPPSYEDALPNVIYFIDDFSIHHRKCEWFYDFIRNHKKKDIDIFLCCLPNEKELQVYQHHADFIRTIDRTTSKYLNVALRILSEKMVVEIQEDRSKFLFRACSKQ